MATRRKRKEIKISACIITFNEEKRIKDCLNALSFVDEIIILDSNSTDNTESVARKYGAKFYKHTFSGYVNQKNMAISKANGQWVLVVDADEIVSPGLKQEIQSAIESENKYDAYRIPRMSFYLGEWIRFSGWYPDYNIRLFKNGKGTFQGGTVHERLTVNGRIGTFIHHLEHYSYENISHHLIRIDQYSTLIAQDKYEKGKKSSITWAILKSFSKFFITYVYRLGFLDGRAGLVIAIMGGYYNFLKYVKLWELQRGLRIKGPVKTEKFRS